MPPTIADIFKPRSLQQRTAFFILLPTFIILLVMSMVSMFLVRKALLDQWQLTALTRLERSAQLVDSRLFRMKRLLTLFQGESGQEMNRQVSRFLMEQIQKSDGVMDVKFDWYGEQEQKPPIGGGGRMYGNNQSGLMMRYHRIERLDVTTPIYDSELKGETVSLVSEFRGENDETLGRVEVKISFYDLIGNLADTPWWQSYELFLVDNSGNVLTKGALIEKRDVVESLGKFGGASELEKKTLMELKEKKQGIVFGEGTPPDQISGFYRLKEAPWTLVVIAPGKLVLEPILKFRIYYFLTGFIGLMLALWLIRSGVNRTTDSIKNVTNAAGLLAKGKFGAPLEINSIDEVGELTRNFNIMTAQLRERMELQAAMGIAREVQQNLLPNSTFADGPVFVAGSSVYCDETGGDYFDLLVDSDEPGKIGVVVGDVVGHGIGAALLMATVRALVRCRMTKPGELDQAVADVNRLLCRDTSSSGNFVSLFYLMIDQVQNRLQWVRCGHDPAIIYDMDTEEFSELHGAGLVLGVDEQYDYRQNCQELGSGRKLILIGSDGVWDAENSEGERFGRQRVKDIMRASAEQEPDVIIESINRQIVEFRKQVAQNDDITLVVVKIIK